MAAQEYKKSQTYQWPDPLMIEFRHPHTISLDIKGNFHRGLMLGFFIGLVSGIAWALLTLALAVQWVQPVVRP